MNTTHELDEFRATLDSLETALNTPIVAGELADWTQVVGEAWSGAAEQVSRQIEDIHPHQFDEMADADGKKHKVKNAVEFIGRFEDALIPVRELVPAICKAV